MRTLLLVEDDPALALGLRDTLSFEGFRVLHAESGESGVDIAIREHPDCIILDLMLPDMNGYQVCETIRVQDEFVPIIMLTARGQEADKIRGLNAGADDYVTKPFSVGELVARIRAAVRRVRRSPSQSGAVFGVGQATVDPNAHTIVREGETISISFYEAELLRLLHRHVGEPVSRDEILEKVWGAKVHQPNNRTVDNFVVKLRKKIEPNHEKPRHILTVYGYGYKLVV
jgi:DNA-binding response OmpR family regulator